MNANNKTTIFALLDQELEILGLERVITSNGFDRGVIKIKRKKSWGLIMEFPEEYFDDNNLNCVMNDIKNYLRRGDVASET